MSINDFAKKAGVSAKEIYLRLDNPNDELNKYTKFSKRIQGKLIKENALLLFK